MNNFKVHFKISWRANQKSADKYNKYIYFEKGMDDVQVRGAATDIFSYLVEYNPSMVREFVMQESQQNDDVSIYTKAT